MLRGKDHVVWFMRKTWIEVAGDFNPVATQNYLSKWISQQLKRIE